MRIISGTRRSHSIRPPKKLPIRPTTDFCKESLFNILQNNFNLKNCSCLDLFSGSGNISFEWASRGAYKVTAVDQHFGCFKFIKETSLQLNFDQIKVFKADALKFAARTDNLFDLVFADPPYAYKDHDKLVETILNKPLIAEDGWFILEHDQGAQFDNSRLFDQRKFGQSILSFFK